MKDCAKGMVEKPDLAPATRGVGRRKQGRRRCSAQPRGEGEADPGGGPRVGLLAAVGGGGAAVVVVVVAAAVAVAVAVRELHD